MSKLTLHLQYEPDYLPNFVNRCQGKLATIKGVNCYPNVSMVSTLGRVYVDDNLSNELVMHDGGQVLDLGGGMLGSACDWPADATDLSERDNDYRPDED